MAESAQNIGYGGISAVDIMIKRVEILFNTYYQMVMHSNFIVTMRCAFEKIVHGNFMKGF